MSTYFTTRTSRAQKYNAARRKSVKPRAQFGRNRFFTPKRLGYISDMVHYAQSWEDPNLLWEGWQRSCPNHVHMVASGGDHALELLQNGLPSVHAYDTEANQLQHIHAKLEVCRQVI